MIFKEPDSVSGMLLVIAFEFVVEANGVETTEYPFGLILDAAYILCRFRLSNQSCRLCGR